MGDVSVGAVNAKVGADVSDYKRAMVEAASSTRDLGDASSYSKEQIVELANASEKQRAKLLELWSTTTESTEGTKAWTESMQRAAMAMSAMHDQANKLNEGLDHTKDSVSTLSEQLLKATGLGAALGGGMAAGVAIATEGFGLLKEAVVGSIESYVSFGHNIDLIHEKLGVTLEYAAAWEQSASATGISAERVTSSLAMMDQRLATGNKQAIEAVNELGLSLADLRDAAPEKQVEMLAAAFALVATHGGKADVIVKELMGRGGLGMLPELTHDMQELQRQLVLINGPLDEQAKTAERYEITSALLLAHWEKLRRTLTEPLIGGALTWMSFLSNQFGGPQTAPKKAVVGVDTPGPPEWSGETVNVVASQADVDRAERAARSAAAHEMTEALRQEAIEQRNLTAERKAFDAVEKGLTTSENALREAEAGEDSTLAMRIQKVRDHAEVEKASAEVEYDHAVALGVDKEAMRADTDETKANIDRTADLTVARLEGTDALKHANDLAKEQLAVDSLLTEAEGGLAKANGDTAAAIDASTQKALDKIYKQWQEIEADQTLLPLEKMLLEIELAHAAALVELTGEQKKHIAALTETATDADLVVKALENMGDAGKGWVLDLAVAFQTGAHAAEQMAKATNDTQRALIAAGAAASVYSSGQNASSGGAAAFQGMDTGATVGSQYGPVGAVVGGVVGTIIGIVGYANRPEFRRVMEDVGARWGVAISDGLAKAIAATESRDHVSAAMAELLNIDAIIKASGEDPYMFRGQIDDLMNAIATGAVPAKEGITELGKAFNDLKAAADSGSLYSEEAMIKLIQRSRELGESIPEVSAFVLDSLQKVATALPTYFAGFGDNPGADVSGANAQILGASFQGLAAQEGVAKAAADLTKAFDQLTKGMPAGMALPASLAHMAIMVDLLKDAKFKQVAEASQAGSEAMKGLEQTGYLSQETTNAFQTGAIELQKKAVQAAIDHGYSPDEARVAGEEANLPMLAQLQHAQDMGATLSPEAQKILTQAQTDGVLPLKSVADQQLLALQQIAINTGKGVQPGAPPGSGVPPGTGNAGSSASSGKSWHWGGPPPPKGHPPDPGWQWYGAGGYVPPTPGGQPAMLGERGEGEYVIPQSQLDRLGMGGPSQIVLPINIGGAKLETIVVDLIKQQVYTQGGEIISYLRRGVTGRP